MLLIVVLALVAVGAMLGAAGMKRLGRWTAKATGRWRPGVGVGSMVLLFSGMAVSARGAWIIGLPLAVAGAGMALVARKRAAKPDAAGPDAARQGMSEADARAMLGVGPQASPGEIKAAYIRLMQRVHPDQGGASGLASQLNAARDRLLG